jgi:hypothetical protein
VRLAGGRVGNDDGNEFHKRRPLLEAVLPRETEQPRSRPKSTSRRGAEQRATGSCQRERRRPRLKQWLGGAAQDAERAAEGGEPVATGTGASIGEQPERERSTNAQVAGASDEPWPGNE